MSEDWPDGFPQIDLPVGMADQRYNPYRRQMEQVVLATRFLDDARALPVVGLQPLDPDQLAVRCCYIAPMQRKWCQNPTAFLIHAERDGLDQWVPSCGEHLAHLVRGVAEGDAMIEAERDKLAPPDSPVSE